MANPITPTVVEKLVTTDTTASSLVVGGASPVATTGTGGINAGAIVGTLVADSVGTMATIRAGGIGIASQAADDLILASSATQLKRLVKTNLGVLVTNGTGVASWLAGAASQYLRLNSGGTAFEMAAVVSPMITILASDFTKTTDTTLADITGLTCNVEAGQVYTFRAWLPASAVDATGDVKFSVAGTATATSVIFAATGTFNNTVTMLSALVTSLGGAAIPAPITNAGVYVFWVEGTITVNGAGTLTVQAAENAATGTLTIAAGASWTVTKKTS